VSRSEIHALVGGNGSGKSTLIKVLAGVEVGDPGGVVAVAGHEVASDRVTPAWSAAAGLRFVHQDLGVFESLTVAENLFAGQAPPRRFGRIDWRGLFRVAQADLDRFGIRVGADQILGLLRPADRTLVAVARALRGNEGPGDAVLVLDEPTTRLPSAEVETLLTSLRDYATQGQTILYVSHRLDEVLAFADRITVLRDGRLVATRRASELDEARLVELMVGHGVTRERDRLARQYGPVMLDVRGLQAGPLHDLDLTVASGEVVGVAGLVGSGRTQLLESIFGARPRTGGVATLNGERLPPGEVRRAIRMGVSLVPEDRGGEGIFADLGIPENLSASRSRRYSKHGWFRHHDERRDAAHAVSAFGVKTPTVTATLNTLSGGNQQKVVVGRWLGHRPKLLLLDEPTQGVDIAAREDIHRHIDRAASEGCAVLVVSSDLDELTRLADRVIVLSGGTIAADSAGNSFDRRWIADRIYATTASWAAA
jgi:ribose transport system ATP-binding protein